ncbi:MAG: lipopolysaccharide assembly protein LapA domain-containing protein [Xanthomonadales bacterium]|nr:lipopolysaccharide assembly protein LapA domain-containing protein [Xanthomonadales bacterium]
MYRIGFIFVVVLAITLGVVIGTLNPEIVNMDLLWFQLAWPLGLTLICVLILGALIGLLLMGLFTLWPMKLRLRKVEKQLANNALTTNVLTKDSIGNPDV